MAWVNLRKLTKKFIVGANCIVIALFLLACLIPFVNPAKWWFIGFLGLIVPHLFMLLVFFLIFWLIVKPKFALLSFIVLLIGWKQLSVLFAVHFTDDFTIPKTENTIRIVNWNIRSFLGLSNDKEKQKKNREQIAESIDNLQPDVICLQEFNHSNALDNLSLFTKTYPYYFFSKDFTRSKDHYESGSIIFSRFPFIDSGKIKYPGNNAESLIYIDVLHKTDTIRIFTTHLQSFKFKKADYEGIDQIASADEKGVAASAGIIQKMKRAFVKRGIQAKIVREVTNQSNHPSVICGDFNDVPNSFTYLHIKNNRQDVFLQKGFGIGRTYNSLTSTLRIDYILPDNNFLVKQFDMIDEDLSDHNMLVADLQFKKK